MWAAWPAAGTLFTLEHILAQAYEVFESCLVGLYDSYPADPLIARKRGKPVPVF